MTADEAAIVTAFTGISIGDFHTFHGYAERVMGRPIWTHQFADEALWVELKEAARPDFVSIEVTP